MFTNIMQLLVAILVPPLSAPVVAFTSSLATRFSDGSLTVILWTLVAWSLVWKGLGLWTAVRRRQNWWFIALLIINTIGILEIVYIFLIEPTSKGKGVSAHPSLESRA